MPVAASIPIQFGVFGVVFLAALAAVQLQNFALLIAGAVLLAATVVLLIRPEWNIPLVLFCLYANVAVVAMKFHGVPGIVAKLAPAPLLIPILKSVLLEGAPIVIPKTVRWIFLFLIVQFVSALLSFRPGHAIDSVMTSVLEGFAIYFIVVNAIRTKPTVTAAAWAFLAAGAFMGFLSFAQQVTPSSDYDFGGFAQLAENEGFHVESGHGTVRQRRHCGPIGEQNRYAQIMLMLVPIGISVIFMSTKKLTRTLAAVATLLTVLGCALTFSRGVAIGGVLVVVAASCFGFVRWKHLAIIMLCGLVMVVSLPQYRTRLATISSSLGILQEKGVDAEPDGAIRGRATAMLAAARIWMDYPILGIGPDLSQEVTRQYGIQGGFRSLEGNRKAHCLYLELGAEIGTLGLLAFMMIVVSSCRQLWRLVEGQHSELSILSAGAMMAIVAFLATGLFLHFSYVRYFWMTLGFADAVSNIASGQTSTKT